MPEREMKQFKVYAGGDGFICIEQNSYDLDEHDDIVSIHPAQIKSLTKWLNDVRDELEKENKNKNK